MRKKVLVLLILPVLFFSNSTLGYVNLTDSQSQTVYQQNSVFMGLDQTEPTGVVVIDDMHNNDYTDGFMDVAIDELENIGFYPYFSSEFDSFADAIAAANYLVIPAIYTSFSESDKTAITTWFEDQPANLLVASRGDFSPPEYASMNSLLSSLGTEMQMQDDNLYTTDVNAVASHRPLSSNYNTSFTQIFKDVNLPMEFFSPSSIYIGGTAQGMIYAEEDTYQVDENGNPPDVIYDDTADGTGGSNIPLAAIDVVEKGVDSDRIVAIGTTMWSNYDYDDQLSGSTDDIQWFHNLMFYFRDQTLAVAGEITLNIEDTKAPTAQILFPHNQAYLKGTVDLEVAGYDAFGIASYEIKIADTVVSTGSTYTWDTTKIPDGIYNVTVTVTDNAGNTGSKSNTYFVTQDFVPQAAALPKILTYNIKESGLDDRWLDVLHEENGDVIILVETGDFDDNNNALLNQVTTSLNEYFFDELPYNSYAQQKFIYPTNGIAILSRFNIDAVSSVTNLIADNGTTVYATHPILHAVINVGETDINIIGGHLKCCSGQVNWDKRFNEQEGTINYMDSLGANAPIIYMGDMNAESPDDVNPDTQNPASDLGTAPIAMIIDSTNPSASENHTFTDVAFELGTEAPTFLPGNSRIDYIFANQFFSSMLVSSTTADTASADKGSDHVTVDVIMDWSSIVTETNYDLTTVTKLPVPTPPKPAQFPMLTMPLILLLIPILKRRKYIEDQ